MGRGDRDRRAKQPRDRPLGLRGDECVRRRRWRPVAAPRSPCTRRRMQLARWHGPEVAARRQGHPRTGAWPTRPRWSSSEARPIAASSRPPSASARAELRILPASFPLPLFSPRPETRRDPGADPALAREGRDPPTRRRARRGGPRRGASLPPDRRRRRDRPASGSRRSAPIVCRPGTWRFEDAPADAIARLAAADVVVAQGSTTLEAAALGRRVVVARSVGERAAPPESSFARRTTTTRPATRSGTPRLTTDSGGCGRGCSTSTRTTCERCASWSSAEQPRARRAAAMRERGRAPTCLGSPGASRRETAPGRRARGRAGRCGCRSRPSPPAAA